MISADPPGRQNEGLPLFVDLDGTLLATDSLQEVLLLQLKRRPWALPLTLLQLTRNRAVAKRSLSDAGLVPEVSLLPYRSEILAYLREQKDLGRTLVLATAADYTVAMRVAQHIGLFDEVLASNGSCNLKGPAKLKTIREVCTQRGWTGFAYMGDSKADIPVWLGASEVIAVAPMRSVSAKLRSHGIQPKEFERSSSAMRALGAAIRPHQWAKNLLIFLPLALAHAYTDTSKLLDAGLAFITFSLVASSVYVTNDLLDLEADRCHPSKRYRPFASGGLPLAFGPVLATALLGPALALAALTLPRAFLATLLLYLTLTLAYSFWFKRKLLLDVLVLAGLYAVRLLAGGYATEVPISEWLLAFSGFLFLSLAFVKRYAELSRLARDGVGEVMPGRSYRPSDLSVIETVGPTSGYLAVLVLALYINGEQVKALYANPSVLWLLCPLLLYWITRIWFLAKRGEMDYDPIVFALTDRVSLLTALVAVALVMAAIAGWGPTLA